MFGGAAAAAKSLGLRARDWTPWGPAVPSSGPYWEMLVNLARSTQPGVRGAAARGELFGITERGGNVDVQWERVINSQLGRFGLPTPGRLALKQLGQAARMLIEENDPYRAFILATGAPLDPKWTPLWN